jgi:hypothetical protein
VDREGLAVRRADRADVRGLLRAERGLGLARGQDLALVRVDREGLVALRVRYRDRARSRECVRRHVLHRDEADSATRRPKKAR